MLELASWQQHATGLAIGEKKDVHHDCGDGLKLRVSRNAKGYAAWCFRCSDSGFLPVQRDLQAIVAALSARNEADAALRSIRGLPEPSIYDVDDWPDDAKYWFFRAGLSRRDIGKIGAYWHPPSSRVVLPVADGRFYQARAVDGRQPKYISQSPRPTDLLVSFGRGSFPVLTEDVLSAYKIGLVSEGWPAMGTNVPDAYVAEFLRRKRPVAVWLDPDGPGRKAAAKYTKQLRAYGLRTINIVSARDPKLHTVEDIDGILKAQVCDLSDRV